MKSKSKTKKRNPGRLERLVSGASERLLLAVCLKVLSEAQHAAKDHTWVKRNMDAKINRIFVFKESRCPSICK
jgi:hypothetical protein